MEDKLVCDDPQFITMLDTLLQVEVEAAKKTLHSLDTEVKEIKKKTKQQWRTRKELNEGIKNTNENIIVLTVSLNKQRKYNDELLNKIELTKLNLNDEYKVRKSEFEEQETILKEYENAWKDYHAQYEEFPLAKVRKTAQMELRKLEVERAVIDQKIIELRKMSRQKQQIGWMRVRGKLVELARTVLENMALDRRLEELLENIKCRTQELNAIEEEIAAQLKIEEEKKRIRELEMLKMPPPKINLSYMKSHYKTSHVDSWKLNYENSLDSMSVDTMMMEEICQADDNSVEPARFQVDGSGIDAGSPYVEQDQEMEQQNGASEMEAEEDAVPEAIDAPVDEEEGRINFKKPGHPAEPYDLAPPLLVMEDKQTFDPEEEEEPAHKRIRLIIDEQRDSPADTSKGTRAETSDTKRRGESVDRSIIGPRITKIESVRYNVSSSQKQDWAEPKPSDASRGSFQDKGNWSFSSNNNAVRPKADLPRDRPFTPRIRKMDKIPYVPSPMTKIDRTDPNPASSMFSPGHYDYSDNSIMSFCVDNNLASLKGDDISIYGGSVRDFCGCSNMTTTSENRERGKVKGNEDLPATNTTSQISHFSFADILKNNDRKLF